MSHTMNIKTELKDVAALAEACKRLGLKTQYGKVRLYGSQETGAGVFLPGWNYPIVVTDDGTVKYDNYGGRWGNIEELHKLEAYYGLEKAKLEAWKQGYTVTEGYDENAHELTLIVNVGW